MLDTLTMIRTNLPLSLFKAHVVASAMSGLSPTTPPIHVHPDLFVITVGVHGVGSFSFISKSGSVACKITLFNYTFHSGVVSGANVS